METPSTKSNPAPTGDHQCHCCQQHQTANQAAQTIQPEEEKPSFEDDFDGNPKETIRPPPRSVIVPIRERVERPRGRQLRSPMVIESRESSLSVSPTRIRRGRSLSPSMERVSSHHELFSLQAQATSSPPSRDRFVHLTPYNRDVYITNHAFTTVDFRHWFPLLASAAPECWYALSTPDIHVSPFHGGLHAPPPMTLKPLGDPRPVALRAPWINASVALLPAPPTEAQKEQKSPEFPPPLVYLSVQESMTGHSMNNRRYYSPDRQPIPDMAGRSVIGQSIYRVVRSGSREQAAAQAFVHGGGNRWSTVFTCVVKDTGVSGFQGKYADSYRRVKTLQEVIDDDGKGYKGKVFY